MTYLDEVVALLERARANLRDASANRAEGRFRVAVTVAYFGAFCAAKAVLAFHREGAKTHKGVNKQFFRLAVVDSDFPADTASLLSAMQDQRLSADYDQSMAWRSARSRTRWPPSSTRSCIGRNCHRAKLRDYLDLAELDRAGACSLEAGLGYYCRRFGYHYPPPIRLPESPGTLPADLDYEARSEPSLRYLRGRAPGLWGRLAALRNRTTAGEAR